MAAPKPPRAEASPFEPGLRARQGMPRRRGDAGGQPPAGGSDAVTEDARDPAASAPLPALAGFPLTAAAGITASPGDQTSERNPGVPQKRSCPL